MIKLFEQFNNEQEIHDICKKYKIENYTINPDGSIDVDDSVGLANKKLDKLPLNFNRVSGWFNCHNNNLTSLEGSPKEVGNDFICTHNKITTLKGAPILIGRNLDLDSNPLSIIDSSIEIKGKIYIDHTKLDWFKIKRIGLDKLKILFEHGVDYDIFRKDGSINDSRLERLFKDFDL